MIKTTTTSLKAFLALSVLATTCVYADTTKTVKPPVKTDIKVQKETVYTDNIKVKEQLIKIRELKAISDGNQNQIKRSQIDFEKLELNGEIDIALLKVKAEDANGTMVLNSSKGIDLKLNTLKKYVFSAMLNMKPNNKVILSIKGVTSIGGDVSAYVDSMEFDQAIKVLRKQKYFMTSLRREILNIDYLLKTTNTALKNENTKAIAVRVDQILQEQKDIDLTVSMMGGGLGGVGGASTGLGGASAGLAGGGASGGGMQTMPDKMINTKRSILGFIKVKKLAETYIELSI